MPSFLSGIIDHYYLGSWKFLWEEAIRGQISSQISGIMGPDVAKSIEGMLALVLLLIKEYFYEGGWSRIIGFRFYYALLSASAFIKYTLGSRSCTQKALLKFLLDRANSLGMILITGFLLMITMILSSLISLFNAIITQYFGFETYMLVETVNFAVGFGLVMLLFALMFKVLPDILVSWKPVWKGAFFLTTVLFTLGKFLLSLYFNQVKPTSAFGAAGTVILIMMWINYSCMLIFFGAEFTKVYTYKRDIK